MLLRHLLQFISDTGDDKLSTVTLEKISISYGSQTVLSDASATLAKDDRVALCGPNGGGKSTLLRVAAGELIPDAGSVRLQRGARICYLPQSGSSSDAAVSDHTVAEELELAFADQHLLSAQVTDLEERMANGEATDEVLTAYGNLTEELERSGYHSRGKDIGAVMSGLGFEESDRDRPLRELSGGWEMRVALGRVLLMQADLLLLDEPTNYLDLSAREWLEDFLSRGEGGFIVVAHDREFLDRCCRTVLEIREGRLRSYTGGYTSFEQSRADQISAEIKAYELQQQEILRIEAFIRRFRAVASKARLVQSRVRFLERMPRRHRPMQTSKITVQLPNPPRSGRVPLICTGLTMHYGDLRVFGGIDFEVERGARLAVVGKNGAGKSTLMRVLVGIEDPSSGSIRRATGIRQAYFAQDQEQQLDPTLTVLETVQESATADQQQKVRDLLGAFLFTDEDINKYVGVLSGGERVRVALACLLLQPINLLLLDEPTNHLDIISTESLVQALECYHGTLIVVSHDRAFLRRLVTSVLEVDQGGATYFPGDLSYYEWKRREGCADNAPVARRHKLRPAPQANRRKAASSGQDEENRILSELLDLEEQRRKIESDLACEEVWRDGQAMRELKRLLAQNRQREQKLLTSEGFTE